MPAAELSAIEAVIAEAFPELRAAAEMAAPTAAEPSPAPTAAEAALEPGQDIAEPPVHDAAPEAAQAAPAPELVAAPIPETLSAPEAEAELPPVDLDTEFDTEEFLFGEDGAETAAGTGPLAVEAPEPAVAPAALEAEAAAAAAETRPDPLIPIKAMSPEERIALFS
jgi:hypothetical protein